MLSVAVIGHSLVPVNVSMNDIPDVHIDIYRYPGATVNSLTNKLDQRNFWNKTFDLVIICIGGNDLAKKGADQVFDKLCDFVKKVVPLTKYLTVCTVEYQLYPADNRFGVDTETFRRKVIKINRKIRRFMASIQCRYLDMGKTAFTLNKTTDSVHLNNNGRVKFHDNLVRVIKAVYYKEQ